LVSGLRGFKGLGAEIFMCAPLTVIIALCSFCVKHTVNEQELGVFPG
jgi:hypothetical protein